MRGVLRARRGEAYERWGCEGMAKGERGGRGNGDPELRKPTEAEQGYGVETEGTPGCTPWRTLQGGRKVLRAVLVSRGGVVRVVCNASSGLARFRFSAQECSTKCALDTYGQRDCVEKCSMAGKTDLNMEVLRAHSTQTMNGRFELQRFLRGAHASLRNSSPHGGVRERRRAGRPAQEPCGRVHLELDDVAHRAIKVIFGADECRFAEVTKRQHEIADRTGCPFLYSFVPSFFSTPS